MNMMNMITVDIKTLNGDVFQISCEEGSKLYQLLNKIKEYNQDYDTYFLRFFDISTEKEIKYNDTILDGQNIFLVISLDVFIKTEIYCHNDDEYGIEIFWRPFHLKSLKYSKKLDLLYYPSEKVFFNDIDDNEYKYTNLEELFEKECTECPEIKQNIIQEVMKKLVFIKNDPHIFC